MADLQEHEIVIECSELLLKQAEQKWEMQEASGAVQKESLLKKARVKFGGAVKEKVKVVVTKTKEKASFGGREKDDLQLSDEALELEPPESPGQGGVWKEGVLKKRGEKWSGLQKRLF
eukprot:5017103-Prymnesium_polylepis.1